MNANIQIVGTVVSNTPVKGTTAEGKKFNYNKLVVKTQNGKHWETIKPRKEADKTTLKVFASAQEGDTIQFDDCFIDAFYWSGKACVSVLANKATKL